MNNQRLIPFLGGLAIGGIGGAAFNNNNKYPYYYNNTYPSYNNYYPPYYNYQYMPYNYYQSTPSQGVPVNTNNYIQYDMYQSNVIAPNKLLNEEPFMVTFANDTRNLEDISNVPIYRQY